MKRLIVSGLPCPKNAWEEWLGAREDQRILPMLEVYENTHSSDIREMSKYVGRQIESFRPDSILCHGFGVSMTLLSLLRLQRRGILIRPRVTIFNGALRGVSLRKANHPIRAQWMSYRQAIKEVGASGGQVDPKLRAHFPRIRAMYRYIMLFHLAESIASRLQLERFMGVTLSNTLKLPMQMIVSPTDPYVPMEAIQQLRIDFRIKKYHEVKYGHFPYSIPYKKVAQLLTEFEESNTTRPTSVKPKEIPAEITI